MILYTAYLPHPPIMLPEIGGAECQKIAKSINSQKTVTQKIKELENKTDLLIIMSPHAQAGSDYFPFYLAEKYSGSLGNFGRPDLQVAFNGDKKLSKNILDHLKNKVNLEVLDHSQLDHGEIVPLYELAKANYQKPILFCGLNIYGQKEHYLLGEMLAEFAQDKNKNIIFIGSGDMSHALKEDGPYQYNPAGPEFDKTIVSLIENGKEKEFLNIDPVLQENAAECGFRSLLTISGIINKTRKIGKVLSYEGPFGVGYLAAEWI